MVRDTERQLKQQQQQIFDGRHGLIQDHYQQYDVNRVDYAQLHTSPGGGRRTQRRSSNGSLRNPFHDDNHRINIVVSSPQRYVRQRYDAGRRQDGQPQYRRSTAVNDTPVRHSAGDPGRLNHRQQPFVDQWQRTSPSSIHSPTGWSTFAGIGYVPENPEQAANFDRARHMPGGFSGTGMQSSGSNPGDKLTQRYQNAERRINSGQRRVERDDESALSQPDGGAARCSIAPDRDATGQYAANNLANTAEEQTFNQQQARGLTVIDQYAKSGFENADSNRRLVSGTTTDSNNNSNATMRTQASMANGGEAVVDQQKSSHIKQTEQVPPTHKTSVCPLFSGR